MSAVTITRCRDPLEGQSLRVLGRLRRRGGVELLVVLPDGSKRLIPAARTDLQTGNGGGAATLGSLGDLLAACALVSALSARQTEQAARQPPCKEDDRAACAAQSDAGEGSGAIPMLLAQLPEPQVVTAIGLLAGLIAKTAAAEGSSDE